MRAPLLALTLAAAAGFVAPALLGLNDAAADKTHSITLAYLGGDLVRPGVRISYEARFFDHGGHQVVGAAHVGGHTGPTNGGYSLLIYLDSGYRFTNARNGLFFEARAGLGYANATQPAGPQIRPDGGSVLSPESTTNYLAPIGLAGFGWDLHPRTMVPISSPLNGTRQPGDVPLAPAAGAEPAPPGSIPSSEPH